MWNRKEKVTLPVAGSSRQDNESDLQKRFRFQIIVIMLNEHRDSDQTSHLQCVESSSPGAVMSFLWLLNLVGAFSSSTQTAQRWSEGAERSTGRLIIPELGFVSRDAQSYLLRLHNREWAHRSHSSGG